MQESSVLITNDAVVLGLMATILGAVFYTSHSDNRFFKAFYKYVPALLLCYFIPSLFNSFGVIDGEGSSLYKMASRYLLPASLVLLTLSVDFKAILGLGPKALIMFLTGTLGIVIGGPIALMSVGYFFPQELGGDVWRGMTTIAGSWIGGGANQAAMKEVFNVDGNIFSVMITVDVLVANVWMAVLLFIASRAEFFDRKNGADTRGIMNLRQKIEQYQAQNARIPNLNDIMLIVAVAFGVTGLSHALADIIAPWIERVAPQLAMYSLTSTFFWLVVIATTVGLYLSTTRVRKLEAVGASKVGSAFLYILVATIGMHMDVTAIFSNKLMFLVGIIWMLVHAVLLLVVARLIKAPMFYMAVGSQANVGGAASAPVVAAAFHPSLAPVGVLLAVLGYGLGTYGAYICGLIMQQVAP
ncbi:MULTISPECIES: DUF819 family protein [Rheinheimera]|jgi:uncharacterized membrane protein|uniref:DUF819 family protein n=1 Tax=Rheinheimera TaxID=67575 RepID=UPI00074AE4A4|nr:MULTISPECIES: DUF819 family protein [Rheinheimera]KUM54529.1 hypothetical protein AR688_14570 [Rheinheimera sp. EpRS3]MDR6983404.1 putative membrane protein [Rheinheimera pacifica]PKM21023.1 MAG: DUF819 domain-containing protein [Gammaproteobacteria bacterium HGW-Gammaproteobacteria-15]